MAKKVRYAQPLLGEANPAGYLIAVPGASVLIRQNGVACSVFADEAGTAMTNPVPTGVPQGTAGVDNDGTLLVYLTAGSGYDGVATVGAAASTFAIPTVSPHPDDTSTGLREANTRTADYTLVLSDAGKAVEVNSATAKNVTVPPNSSVAFAVGTIIEVPQVGAGVANLVAGAGVTITGDTVTPGQGGSLLLRKTGTNAWWSSIVAVRSGTYADNPTPGTPKTAVATAGDQIVDGAKTWTGRQLINPSAEPTNLGSTFSNRTVATTQAAADTVTKTAHGLSNGTRVGFFKVTTTTGISLGVRYYVVNAAANTFQVSLTAGGAPVNLATGDGTVIYGTEDVDVVNGVGEEQWRLDTPIGSIAALSASGTGLRMRLNLTQEGYTSGVRLMKHGFPCVDFDIDTEGRMFIDDVSVRPSFAWIIGEPGMPSHAMNIGPSRVIIQRQLSLSDLGTGAEGMVLHYTPTDGLQFFDVTSGAPSRVGAWSLGATGTFLIAAKKGLTVNGNLGDEAALHLVNNQNGKKWRVAAFQEGVSFDNFTIRDASVGRDCLQINHATGHVVTWTGLEMYGDAPQWGQSELRQSTVGGAGGAAALPATPATYLKVKKEDGTVYVVPAYLPA